MTSTSTSTCASSSSGARGGNVPAGPSACPLCYEAYALGEEDPLLVPRQLPCGDTGCTGCLQDSLDEASLELVCQTCLRAFILASATVQDALPVAIVRGPAIATEEDDAADSRDVAYDDESPLSSFSSGSRLVDFMRDVPASAANASTAVGPDGLPQSSPAFTPRALSAAEQAAHARAHRRLAEAKLSRLRLQRDGLDRARVKVNLQSVESGTSMGARGTRTAEEEGEQSEAEEGPWGRLDPEELAARFKVIGWSGWGDLDS